MKKIIALLFTLCCIMSLCTLSEYALNDGEETASEEVTTEITGGESTEEPSTGENTEEPSTGENTEEPSTEEKLPEGRFMCDADASGKVTAADARMILRRSVGLEKIAEEELFYMDADLSGSITASDARTALRISVGLDGNEKYAFEIISHNKATCESEGSIKAVCAITGKENKFTVPALSHVFSEKELCLGKGICTLCKKEITFDKKHNYEENRCKGQKVCSVCGDTVTIPVKHEFEKNPCAETVKCKLCGAEEKNTPVHSYKNGICTLCKKNLKKDFGSFAKKYLIKKGTYDAPLYYVTDEVDGLSFALVHDKEYDTVYAICTFGINVNGYILYYDIYFDFIENTSELLYYDADGNVYAYVAGNITPSKIKEEVTGNAISVIEFDVHPELTGYRTDLLKTMEGTTYLTVSWLKSFSKEIGFKDSEELFTDYKYVKS